MNQPVDTRISVQDSSAGISRLSIFALLYAWANILHQLSYPEWIKGPHAIGWLLFVSSAALALKPNSIKLFLVTLSLRLAFTLDWMPMIREHLFLEGLFTLGILISLVPKARNLWQNQSFSVEQQEALFECFAPFLRVTCLIVYGAVTICKLNSEFLDPAKSESVNLLMWTAKEYSFVPTDAWVQVVSVWGTLLFEGGIPVLLLFRRTRWLGVFTGLVFHTILGFLPLNIWSFTSTMILLLFAWLPPQSAQIIHQSFLKVCQNYKLRPSHFAILFYLIAGASGMAYAARNGLNWDMRTLDLGTIVWWWQTAIIFACAWVVRRLVQESTAKQLRISSTALQLYTLLIIFNCLCPYLGLKNRLALSMHCNLRTANGYWNHLFFPESMRVFTYQNNLITIVDTDMPDFESLRKLGIPLPYFEFRRWCRRSEADFYVNYLDSNGIPQRFEKTGGEGSDPELMEAHPFLEKFLCFNPIGANYDYMPESIPHVGPARNRFFRIEVEK